MRNILFVLAAVVWLPITAHCQLEKITGLEFFACPSECNSAGKDSGCNSDTGCCAAEKPEYKCDQARVTIPSRDLLPLLPVAPMDLTDTSPDEIGAAAFAPVPPEFPRRWHFVFRMALLPRAPSFTS